jgi:lambda family phage portal protein
MATFRWPWSRAAETPKKRKTTKIVTLAGANLRFFKAGKTDNLSFSWTGGGENIDSVIAGSLDVIRDRSRERFANDPLMRRYVQLLLNNVVGADGVNLVSEVLNPDGTPDDLANDAVEAAWREWSRPRTSDLSERLSFRDILSLVMESVVVDGEAIIQLHQGRSINKNMFALQPRDAARLDHTLNRALTNGNQLINGIEFDQRGRAVRYYFGKGHMASKLGESDLKKGYDIVPADRILHIFRQDFVNQKRGVPWAANVMNLMKMLDGADEAALTATRIGAAKMGFFTSAEHPDAYTGDAEESDGSLIMNAEPGVFDQLPPGVEFQTYDPEYPKGEYGTFTGAILKRICSGLGLSYIALSNDGSGVSYSTARTFTLEDREFYKRVGEMLIEKFAHPVREQWLANSLAAGQIKSVRDRPLPASKYDQFNRASFTRKRLGWVDPKSDMAATQGEIAMGTKTVSQAIREMGMDPNDVFRERAAELETMKNLGIPSTTAQSPLPPGVGDDDQSPDDGQGDDG